MQAQTSPVHRCPSCKRLHACAGRVRRNTCKLVCAQYGEPFTVYVAASHNRKLHDAKRGVEHVQFYVAVRDTLLEPAFDASHLHWQLCARADLIAYFTILSEGWGKDALVKVLRILDSGVLSRFMQSLEQLLDVEEGSESGANDDSVDTIVVMEPLYQHDEFAMYQAALEQFGIWKLPGEIRELLKPGELPISKRVYEPIRGCLTPHGPFLPLQCDECLRDTGAPLYRIRRDGTEVCYQCLVVLADQGKNVWPEREEWLRERIRRY